MSLPPPPPPPGRPRAPRVVAELGRPETPEETAARKAESSYNHRINQTTKNLVLSIGASLAIVLFLVIVVVRPGKSELHTVDYRQIASQAQPQIEPTLVAPRLPSGWTSNSAQIRQAGSNGVTEWYVGLITPDTQFIGVTQGIDANPTWIANALDEQQQTGTRKVDGLTWQVYDQRDKPNTGNLAYSMVVTVGKSTVILSGTASNREFGTLAGAATEEITS